MLVAEAAGRHQHGKLDDINMAVKVLCKLSDEQYERLRRLLAMKWDETARK